MATRKLVPAAYPKVSARVAYLPGADRVSDGKGIEDSG
jgi:hypothetical protein